MKSDEIAEEIGRLDDQTGILDFDKGPDITNIYMPDLIEADLSERTRQWQRVFGDMIPGKVHKTLKGQCQDVNIFYGIKSHAENDREYQILLQHYYHDIQINTALSSTQRYDKTKDVHIDGIQTPKEKGAGGGKRVLAAIVDFVSSCCPQAESITLSGVDIGAYAWIKLGVLPDEDSWRGMKRRMILRKEALANYDVRLDEGISRAIDLIIDDREVLVAKGLITAAQGRDEHFYVASEHPESARILADMAYEITVPETGFYHRDLHQDTKDVETTLGKYLLIGNDWSGKFDMKDEKTWKQFRGYTTDMSADRSQHILARDGGRISGFGRGIRDL